MIRNHGNGSAVRDTAKLIETLKKVGVIKTKKRRARRSLAKDEIRQDNDMGPGFAISMPPQFGASPQQQDYNAQRIEDIQRQSSNQIALLRSQLQQVQQRDTNRFGLPQRIEDVPKPKIEDVSPVVVDVNEFEGRSGANRPQGENVDFDEETATGIFVGDESAQAPAELTDEQKIQKVIEVFGHSPIPTTVKELRKYIKELARYDDVKTLSIGADKSSKGELLDRIDSYYLSKYSGLSY